MKKPNKADLDKFVVNYNADTPYASHARLLQSQWRANKGYPMNKGKGSDYGNFLDTEYAMRHRVNFVTENIRQLVTNKIADAKQQRSMIGEPRIWNNLLSSQPLCFNLFGEMYNDLELATAFFKKQFSQLVQEVTKIDFEFSARRNQPDNSAFDVYVEYIGLDNKKAFLGIEVKYTEKMTEEGKGTAQKIYASHQEAYDQLTEKSGYYKEGTLRELTRPPLSQIWRDHLLAFNMSDEEMQGSFVFLYPTNNEDCHQAVRKYKEQLITNDEAVTHFYARDLNKFIRTLHATVDKDWTKELVERYVVSNT